MPHEQQKGWTDRGRRTPPASLPGQAKSQVPLRLREVKLLGPKAGGPLSDYRNVQPHAVGLARSENTCRNNNHGQKCLNTRGLGVGDGVSLGSTQSAIYIPDSTTLGPQHSPSYVQRALHSMRLN